jgi:methionyl aminopeptidase
MIVDAADTRVLGTPSLEQKKIMVDGRDILDACISVIKDGVSLYQILRAGHNLATQRGVYIFPEFGGHVIKKGILHASFIPHTIPHHKSKIQQATDLRNYHATRLQAGQIICLEPIVTEEKTHIILDEDGWTTRSGNGKLSVHYEHCMLVTQEGHQIIC